MSKLKLKIVATVLSLGVACSGFACASKRYIPKLNEIMDQRMQNHRNFDEIAVKTPRFLPPELPEDATNFESFYSTLLSRDQATLSDEERFIVYDKALIDLMDALKSVR